MKVKFKYIGEGRDGEVYIGFTQVHAELTEGKIIPTPDIELELTAEEAKLLLNRLCKTCSKVHDKYVLEDASLTPERD